MIYNIRGGIRCYDASMETEVPSSSPPPQPPSGTPQPPVSPEKRERDWTLYTHLAGLCCLVGIPSFVGPLVMWLIKKDEMPRVNAAGKDALNFHLTMTLIALVSIPLAFVIIGVFTAIAAQVLAIIFSIVAGLEANKGVNYRYPLTIQFVK